MSEQKGRLFIISAPSGTGKGTVIERLRQLRPELYYSISATTRKPRDGEVDGVSYYFVDHERFRELISSDAFLEYAEYIGEYYGTPKSLIQDCIYYGKDILLEIEVQGARQVMALDPEAVTIFIVPPSLEVLEQRLRGRKTESEEKLHARLERARLELEEKSDYDFVVVNDDIDRAAEEILSIIDRTGDGSLS
ncbi:MAG: guanylate kinase [Oscillospiraceae bacterium]|nr:guanylate kinase [Oscillospiraceae bacterium]